VFILLLFVVTVNFTIDVPDRNASSNKPVSSENFDLLLFVS